MADGEQDLGGGLTGAVRVGDTVRRGAGPWTPTVHRLLRHLRAAGVDGVPEPFGTDAKGREVLTFLPGTVPQYPLPPEIWTDTVLTDTARLLRRVHDATAGMDLTGAVWQLPVHEPVEVVCHNDAAPYNTLLRDGRVVGLIDWDTASPGPRVWDLAYVAYRLVTLTDPRNHDAPVTGLDERARRLRLLVAAYRETDDARAGRVPDDVGPDVGALPDVVVRRLHDLADHTAARVPGAPHLADHVELYRRDARWVQEHATALVG